MTDRPSPSGRVFAYGISRASWVMLGLLAVAVALIVGPYLLFEGGPAALDEESVMALALIALVLGGVLLPVPVLDIIWWLRGGVVIGSDGLHWRGWGGSRSLAWSEIIGVGQPPSAPRVGDDTRIYVVTRDGCEFIHGYTLRDRDEAVELMVTWAGLPERQQVGRHTFRCRPGASERVAQAAAEHIDTGGYDPWDFWATRFRRM